MQNEDVRSYLFKESYYEPQVYQDFGKVVEQNKGFQFVQGQNYGEVIQGKNGKKKIIPVARN